MSSSCIFPFAFFFLVVLSLLSSAYLCFSSEALRFSASNTRVMLVTVLRFSTLFFQFTLGTFSISVFSLLCLLCLVVFGLMGKFLCDWVLILVSRAFSGGFFTVFWVCLGFLLLPCTFCGLSILLWGRV